LHAVAAQQVGQILREGGARDYCIATCLDRFGLQLSLQVREEADDRGALLQLRLKLRNQGQRLDIRIVQVEDNQAGPVSFLAGGQLSDSVFVILDEGDLDPELARGLGDFGIEKEIFDEEEDLGRRVIRDWNRPANRIVDRLRVADVAASAAVAAALVVALRLDGGRRRIGELPLTAR